MIGVRPLSDTDPALACSTLLRAALLTIGYIEDNGPIGLTPAKRLKRYFVAWAAETFAWPNYTAVDLYAVNKVLNEPDFPPLVVLHDVLLSAKLVRHRKGAMHLTSLARTLRSRPAALWTLLATHILCVIDHSRYTRYTRYGDPRAADWNIFLNVVNIEAQQGVTEERLCSVLFGFDEADGIRHDYRMAAAIYVQLLRPLCWAGLLDEHRIGSGLARREIYTKTPLWSAALTLESDRHLQAIVHH